MSTQLLLRYKKKIDEINKSHLNLIAMHVVLIRNRVSIVVNLKIPPAIVFSMTC